MESIEYVLSHLNEYRIKTEEELIKEFGKRWQGNIHYGWNEAGSMDFLLGQPLASLNIVNKCECYIEVQKDKGLSRTWTVGLDTITKDVPSLNSMQNYKNYSHILK